MKKELDEKIFVEVNGVQQGMFLQSMDTENPVLLFLHGGPGSPEFAFTQENPTGLEELFTVCWWEQRGSGISYQRHIPKEKMTIDQMISDTLVVTSYLQKRFAKNKIYVIGHSWGTLLGMLTVQRNPELFHAYIGVGQLSNQLESERLAYSYMLNEFRKNENRKMIKKLEKFPIDQGAEVTNAYLSVRSAGMMKLGIGVMHHCQSMLDIGGMLLRFKGYTLKEKIKFMQGNSFALNCLWNTIMAIDLTKEIPELAVPVYILHGKYDYQVSYTLAKEFSQTIKAPLVGFYTFEDSAHSPCFEEAEKMCRILQEDVLQKQIRLADDISPQLI
ncbi:alpha/beta fold hydrolase [Enterococcus sp. AZ196]|uniref:alpha/beta fold hydrolase n=1 Tax=Enterococcus sp. AZ196 TaxID=2774659 RepID=UPI003D2C00EB